MATWGRDTPWRQGSLISGDVLHKLGIDNEPQGEIVGIVISHDCDLAQMSDAEPSVEIIVAKNAQAVDGNLTHGKNPRRLHLLYRRAEKEAVIELVATKKATIDKTALAECGPDETTVLDAKSKSILQHWLAARYRRSAFPVEFETRMRAKKIPDKLVKAFRENGSYIGAVLFELDNGDDVTHDSADDPYELAIFLMYASNENPEKALAQAEALSKSVTTIFQDAYRDAAKNEWKQIELVECTPISDEALTFAQAAQLQKWSTDYLSLKEEPQGLLVETK